MAASSHYEMLVLGSGPGGQKAAIAAAKLGHRAAVIERRHMLGGVCINTGTIPSKTLREAVLYLTGLNMRELYGQNYRVKDDITVQDLLSRTQHVIGREVEIVRSQLFRNNVDLIHGTARFVDAKTVAVRAHDSEADQQVTADTFVIATGSRPARPPGVEFDDVRIVDSDGILNMENVPRTMVVVGAGVIGIEYASMFAALGTRVTVVEARDRMLEFCDSEVVDALRFHLRDLSVTFRFGEIVERVETGPNGTMTTLRSGKRIVADTVMYSAGRQGATDALDLAAAGLDADDRGRIEVDARFRTPSRTSTPSATSSASRRSRRRRWSRAGWRRTTRSASRRTRCASTSRSASTRSPRSRYCGATEDELTKSSVPYEFGISRYRELARGQIVGDTYGMLKLLVSTETRQLLGVHIFGTDATELIHIGQAVMTTGGTVDHLVDTVFNYPTLSEAYKVAALDASNKMRAIRQMLG